MARSAPYGLALMRIPPSFLLCGLIATVAAEEAPPEKRIDAAITKGVDFLIADQNRTAPGAAPRFTEAGSGRIEWGGA